MSLPVVTPCGTALPESVIFDPSDTIADAPEFATPSEASVDVRQGAPAMRQSSANSTNSSATDEANYSWPALSAMRGAAEFVWHCTGRLVNAGAFALLANASPSCLRITASVATGVAAGSCGYRFVASRTGDSPCGKALASATGLIAGFAAGTATYYGSAYPSLMVAAASVVSFGASDVQNQISAHDPDAPLANKVPAVLVVGTTGASIATAVLVPGLRTLDIGKLGRRTMALLAEAATIELFKGATERAIPGADRSTLAFERKLKAALIGLLPYAFASVALSGVFGNLLRAQMQSDRFENYFVPLLVGALANVVKGAVNTAIVRCGGDLASCGNGHAECVRKAEGLRRPPVGITLEKTALRFAIASARDVIYLSLVDGGINNVGASCIAYTLYAFFAQHRDLIFDMMQGEGWSEPRISPPARVTSP